MGGLGRLMALTPVGIWTYVLLGRGGFWRVRRLVSDAWVAAAGERVVAVIPARNEADVVGKAVASLVRQRGVTRLEIVVVDDNSTDGTADRVREAGERAVVVQGRPLEHGWTGKLWALEQGVQVALEREPDYLLFTDADIEHGEWSIGRLLAMARDTRSDLASYMVKLETATAAERLLIPAFVYFFLQLYPPVWSADERRGTAGAAGGCVLIRPEALRRAGGLAAISGEVIDDCALARRVKQSGGRIWLGLTEESRSLRSYGGFVGVGGMIARSAFFQLRHSYGLLAGTVAGLLVTYVAPVAMLASRRRFPALCGGAAWLLMSASYAPMVRFYKRPWWNALTLPAVALFYAGATVFSAWQFARGQGGMWKGRAQDLPRSPG